jgi:asparagine synthase (glutamine-hydrolysing)
MCGISGFCDTANKSSEDILRKMTDTLLHRGPDSSGYKFFNDQGTQIGLGHRRLSIIDLSPNGHQPMTFGECDIIFNGEIYNFMEVRKELQSLGYRFASHSDTEVVLVAFAEWGMDMLKKFIGMFAFCLHDRKNKKMYLVRDRVGVKPLYYYYYSGTLLFSSELKAFHKHPSFSKVLNEESLFTYFQFGYSINPATIFKNTFQVRPGAYIEYDITNRTLSEKKYWEIEDYYQKKIKRSEEEIFYELEKLLSSAANYRMVSDVPVGVFLSGGYDSSMITALLQKERTERIKTFTIGFSDSNFDESPHAKKVAQHLGTDHTEYYCSTKDVLELVPDIPFYFDEPFADYSAIPTMLVSKLAKNKVTVALSADGGDELFGGYPKYLHALKYRKFSSLMPNVISDQLGNIYELASRKILQRGKLAKYQATNNKIVELIKGSSAVDFARINVQQFEEAALHKLLRGQQKNIEHLFYSKEFFKDFQGIDNLLLLDSKVYLPDDLLVKIDRSTMSVSLEGREPLLDHRLMEFMGSVDPSGKLGPKGNSTKYYLKKLAHQYVPEALLNRPKMGFTPPLALWLRGPLKECVLHYLSESRIKSQDLFNYKVIEDSLRDFFDHNHDKTGKKIWNMMMFQMWYEKWMS